MLIDTGLMYRLPDGDRAYEADAVSSSTPFSNQMTAGTGTASVGTVHGMRTWLSTYPVIFPDGWIQLAVSKSRDENERTCVLATTVLVAYRRKLAPPNCSALSRLNSQRCIDSDCPLSSLEHPAESSSRQAIRPIESLVRARRCRNFLPTDDSKESCHVAFCTSVGRSTASRCCTS